MIQKYQTYGTWRETHQYPAAILNDEYGKATCELIDREFWLRETQPNFTRFFIRELIKNYPYFKEAIKIDPTMAEYDWFVTNYAEDYNDDTDTNEQLVSRQIDEIGNPQTVYGKSSETTQEGPLTPEGNTSTETYTREGEISRIEAGKEIDEGETAGTSQNIDRNIAYARTNPQSQSYSTSGPTTQGKIIVGVTNSPNLEVNTPDDLINRPEIKNPTTSSDALTESAGGNEGRSRNIRSFDGRQSAEKFNGYIETRNRKDQRKTQHDTEPRTDKQTLDRHVTENDGKKQHISIYKKQSTGRFGGRTIADIITEAYRAIGNTQAFDMLITALDGCFQQGYNLNAYRQEEDYSYE